MRTLLLVMILTAVAIPHSGSGQQARVNQRKIEREKKQKERLAQKEYKAVLKRHHQRQSKETKAMMKNSRKQAKKTIPVR